MTTWTDFIHMYFTLFYDMVRVASTCIFCSGEKVDKAYIKNWLKSKIVHSSKLEQKVQSEFFNCCEEMLVTLTPLNYKWKSLLYLS